MMSKSTSINAARISTHHFHHVGGKKAIGYRGSFALMINNIIGPGLSVIPVFFQHSGWLESLLSVALCAMVGALAATMLVEAMTRMPHNERFAQRVEMMNVAQFYFGRPSAAYYLTLALFIFSLITVNIAAIIQSAQVTDFALVAIDKTCGLQLYPAFKFICVDAASTTSISPYDAHSFVISGGLCIIAVLSIPLGLMNLDDNIWVQKICLVLFMLIGGTWVGAFGTLGFDGALLPAVAADHAGVIGPVLLNFAFVTTVPSWVNEKRGYVSVNRVIWLSVLYCTIVYALIGVTGALSFRFSGNAELLSVLTTEDARLSRTFQRIIEATVYIFPFSTLVSGIPIFMIIVRYNLIANNVCHKHVATFVSIILPWLIVVPFYTGAGFSRFVNWSSLFIQAGINFLVPFVLYLMSFGDVRERARRYAAYQQQLESSSEEEVIEDLTDEEAVVSSDEEAAAGAGARGGGAREATSARVAAVAAALSDKEKAALAAADAATEQTALLERADDAPPPPPVHCALPSVGRRAAVCIGVLLIVFTGVVNLIAIVYNVYTCASADECS